MRLKTQFQSAEVVAICDHLVSLRARQLKHEIVRKPRAIPLDLLVEALRSDAVELSSVDQGLVAANDENASCDGCGAALRFDCGPLVFMFPSEPQRRSCYPG